MHFLLFLKGVRSWQKLFGRTDSRFEGQNTSDNNCPSPVQLKSSSMSSTVPSQISSQHWLPGICLHVYVFWVCSGVFGEGNNAVNTDIKWVNVYQPLDIFKWVGVLYKSKRCLFLPSQLDRCSPLCNQFELIQLVFSQQSDMMEYKIELIQFIQLRTNPQRELVWRWISEQLRCLFTMFVFFKSLIWESPLYCVKTST